MAECISGLIELQPPNRRFWTNGDILTGALVLKCNAKKISIQSTQASMLCEEWVHTVHLEFKEHYRKSQTVLAANKSPIILNEGEIARLPIELNVPLNDNSRKLPPSFAFKYNHVVWCVKCQIGYTVAGSEEIHSSQIEQPIQICSKYKLASQTTSELKNPTFNEFSWLANVKNCSATSTHQNKEPISKYHPADNKKLKDMSIQLNLMIPQYGILQTVTSDEPSLGMRLTLNLNGLETLQLLQLEVQIIEQVHTYGKDTLSFEKPFETRKEEVTLRSGRNDLNKLIRELRVHNLTEDFKTEWQQITHILRLIFIFEEPETRNTFKLVWDTPTLVLSEAEVQTFHANAANVDDSDNASTKGQLKIGV